MARRTPRTVLSHELNEINIEPGMHCLACWAVSDFDAIICVRCGQPLPFSSCQVYEQQYNEEQSHLRKSP